MICTKLKVKGLKLKKNKKTMLQRRKNLSLRLFAKFCFGVLSKFLFQSMQYPDQMFQLKILFCFHLGPGLREEKNHRKKAKQTESYQLIKISTMKKVVFDVNEFLLMRRVSLRCSLTFILSEKVFRGLKSFLKSS